MSQCTRQKQSVDVKIGTTIPISESDRK